MTPVTKKFTEVAKNVSEAKNVTEVTKNVTEIVKTFVKQVSDTSMAVYCSISQYSAFFLGHRSKFIWSCSL